jgi:hypothetical protein
MDFRTGCVWVGQGRGVLSMVGEKPEQVRKLSLSNTGCNSDNLQGMQIRISQPCGFFLAFTEGRKQATGETI